jgi:hypothetical protein
MPVFDSTNEPGPVEETITQRLLGKLWRTAFPDEKQCAEESVSNFVLRKLAFVLLCPIGMFWWLFVWDDGEKVKRGHCK